LTIECWHGDGGREEAARKVARNLGTRIEAVYRIRA
jgi:hypothetical protein